MLKLKNKVILTDVDGVLLDWNFGFEKWMFDNQYINHFPIDYDQGSGHALNRKEELKYSAVFCKEAEFIGNLTPFKDSIKYVRKLHEEFGFVFHAITAVNNDIFKARKHNLETIFGKGVFIEIDCVGAFKSKEHILNQYKDSGCYWIEDDIKNAELGKSLGLQPILMLHSYNKDKHYRGIKVNTWREIYQNIIHVSDYLLEHINN